MKRILVLAFVLLTGAFAVACDDDTGTVNPTIDLCSAGTTGCGRTLDMAKHD